MGHKYPISHIPEVFVNAIGSNVYALLDKPVLHGEFILNEKLTEILQQFIGIPINEQTKNNIKQTVELYLKTLVNQELIETDSQAYYIHSQAGQINTNAGLIMNDVFDSYTNTEKWKQLADDSKELKQLKTYTNSAGQLAWEFKKDD